jgi:hypothetical protein
MKLNKDTYWILFLKWLKYKKCYSSFYYCCNNVSDYWKNTYLHNILLKYVCDEEDWLLFAFDWKNSKEGVSFWSNLNKEWRLFLYDFKKQFYKK